MLTLVPEGGLCNRMRATASALVLARRAASRLRVRWYRTADFNCAFGRIFAPGDLPFEVEEAAAMGRLQRATVFMGERALKCSGWHIYPPSATEAGKFDAELMVERAKTQKVYVRTHSRLAVEPGMFDCFRPAGEAAARLAPLLERTNAAVGVHLRRTDNAKAITGSPLSSFIKLMDAEVELDSSARFFVATDSDLDLNELRARFGTRIDVYPKRAYRRDDPTAIEDAVVDLFALAHCKRLIGSHWSSFTDTAHELRQIDHVIAGQAA